MWDSFQWLNSPANWQIEGEKLSIDVSPNTDFWRKTHYGFIRDSGHFYYVKAREILSRKCGFEAVMRLSTIRAD